MIDSANRPLPIEGVIDEEVAARLEDAGVGYVDASGRSWSPGQPRTGRSRDVRLGGTRSLRPESLLLAQLIADHPEEAWTGRGLAARGRSSQVTALSLLKRLEEEGFVERQGAGRATVRQVVDASGLRGWLARNGRPRRVRRLSCFVRDPEAIPNEIEGHALSLTGAAGAAQWGLPVVFGESRPVYRVDMPRDALDDVPAMLGGLRTERGANVTLVADPEGLGTFDARLLAERLTAPPSRVMLDLYLEPRGSAALGVFLDLWGSKSL